MKSYIRSRCEREIPLIWDKEMMVYKNGNGDVPIRCNDTTLENLIDLWSIVKRKGIIEALKYDWRSTVYPRDIVEALRRPF